MSDTNAAESKPKTRPRLVWVVAAVVAVLLVGSAGVAKLAASGGEMAPTPAVPNGPNAHTTYTSVDEMRAHDPFYIAHRGGSGNWPEMSMTAYTNATEWGMGAIEVSVARTKDGKYFGLHDKTLDRTSMVSGGIDPTTLTWDELTAKYQNKLNAASAQGEPYTLVSEIFEKYARTHVIFVDPKYIGAAAQREELIELMLSFAPAEHWVLKGYYDNSTLAAAARAARIQTWGYYYARDLGNFGATAQNWDMLGLEINATADQWATVKAPGKPVIAFFITDEATLAEATAKGADGMMVSDVLGTFEEPKTVGASANAPAGATAN